MMKPTEIEIEIDGSGGSIYRIKLYQTDLGLKTSCSCPAGQKKIHCKHRSAVFAGDFSQIRGEHPENLGHAIASILQGTEIQTTLNKLAIAEQDALRATNELKRVKKSLDRVMHE